MGLRILLTAEQVLGGRTPRRDADKQRLVARRNDLAGFEERGVCLAEVADRGERGGPGEEELDPLLAGSGLREQAERAPKPLRGARRRSLSRRLARFPKEGDRAQVALTGRVLGVVRPGRCRCAALAERPCAPLVRSEPSPARRQLVDGATNQRVAKPEPSRYVRVADEIEAKQLVERPARRSPIRPRLRHRAPDRMDRRRSKLLRGRAASHLTAARAPPRARLPPRAARRRLRGTPRGPMPNRPQLGSL